MNTIAEVYDRIEAGPLNPVWISLRPRDAVRDAEASGPLRGLTFAVKDNIDVAGVPTTAACPEYAYTPPASASVVERLERAGAFAVGKTNMDQFATGLVGTRSPYGACASVFDPRYISGGSSSGSAIAVAKRLVDFALGTDTAGSGRVPAAFNNLVGLKPTRGLLSAAGVVPACRTLDCVSILTRTCADAARVFAQARGFDASDPYSRVPRPGEGAAPWVAGAFRFGVPEADQLEFFGDGEAAALYDDAIGALERCGGVRVKVDFSAFREAASLLYSGPWVAERMAAIETFLREHGDAMDPVVRGIIQGADRHSAIDFFRAEYRLRGLCRAAAAEWETMDVLALPTTGTIYTLAQIAADPVRLNTHLGYYTNFVNLMDLAAIALPAGFRANGLPFGISLIGRAFSDDGLLALGGRYLGESVAEGVPPGCISVAVVGAHLSGQPLNGQLTGRGARLLRTARTAAGYRLYALSGTQPAKPGLVRDGAFQGPGIDVEVWTLPEDQFGGFAAAVPPPLGIGNVTLEDGAAVKGFICEPYALDAATEITSFGGWRPYLANRDR
ncbi:MAG: allophanate hydrolase [Acidobacteria bacterium]|nr:allophanate hydrolase [Acidobacteriota bacterium]